MGNNSRWAEGVDNTGMKGKQEEEVEEKEKRWSRERQIEIEMLLLQPEQINYASKCSLYWKTILTCALRAWKWEPYVQTHQYNTAAVSAFLPFFFPRFPIRSCGSLQAFMPTTNGMTVRLTNTQSLRVEWGKKNQQKPAPITQGHLITPWKKSKQPFVMISLNALITPGDNSIMIVAIKWGFHQDPQTEGGKAIIPPLLRYDVAFNIVLLGHLAEFMTLHNACGEFPRWQQQTL